ncbi:MAG: HAMP domain-containing sensor histidine kinase [Spirulinaceae cyanobacterium]
MAQESSQLILGNLQRAGELVQSFKQVAVDQTNLEVRRFAVKPYLHEVIISLKPQLKKTAHTLTLEGDDTIEVESYPGAFSQIVTNLVINSLIHGYQQGKSGSLYFAVEQQKDRVEIEYKDDGQGINQENLTKIFEPFFTTARNRGGSGLGLHLVYNLVTQKLQGTIQVQSQEGSGTIFKISLPCLLNQTS